jgi:hypothetical protein
MRRSGERLTISQKRKQECRPMSCDYKCKVAGLAVGVSGEAVGAVFHGNPDAEIQGSKVYRYRNVAEVMQALGQADTPAPVRLELLRNLAMNKVNPTKLKGLVSKEERAFYKRQQNVQKFLELNNLPANTKPESVTRLDLRGCRLSSIEGVGEFVGLEVLILNGNNLTDLPPELSKLQHLKDIHLRGNKLTSVPSVLFAMPQLDTIDLGLNSIRTLPPEVKNWVNLRAFSMADTPLESLPKEVEVWEKLEVISLDQTNIAELPTEVGKWRKLQVFRARSGKFETMPKEMGNWTELNELNLAGGAIKRLPAEVSSITKWDTLLLDSNPLEEMPQFGFVVESYRPTGIKSVDEYHPPYNPDEPFGILPRTLNLHNTGLAYDEYTRMLCQRGATVKFDPNRVMPKGSKTLTVEQARRNWDYHTGKMDVRSSRRD